jgi:hypothetical protein
MGGYGWTIRAEELPRLIVELPGKFGASLFGASAPGNVLLALLLALGAAGALVHRSRAVGLLLASLVLVASPVLTVSKAFRPHYAGLAWLTLAIAFGFGCQALLDAWRVPRAAVGLLAAATLGAAFAANRHAWHAGYDRAERGSVEGRAFLAMKDGELLRHPSIPPAAMMELRWFKEVGLALPKGAGWFDDDLYVCAADRNIRGIREYDPRTRSLVDATERLPGIRSNYCAALRDAPLEAAFWRSADGLFWELGPYPSGRYALVFFDGVERVDVARRDGYRNDATVLTLRVRYEAPEGWVTFSPELSADLRAGRPFRWERAAAGR